MSIATENRPSQKLFQKQLRSHLARRHARRSAAPSVDGVRHGLSFDTLDEIREALGLSREALERVLHVSARTLSRRRKRGDALTPAESDRLWRLLHAWNRATEAFGSKESARTWLTEPKAMLGGETPLERLDTEPGLREVEDMLTVIDETAAA